MSFPRKLRNVSSKPYLVVIISIFLITSLWLLYSRKSTYHEVIGVHFTDASLPFVFISIENNSFPMTIDLGSRLDVKLHANIADTFNLKKLGKEKWKNYLGKAFKYPKYDLPSLKVEKISFKHSILTAVPLEEQNEYCIWNNKTDDKQTPKTVGHIGRGLLQKVNLLLDMPASKLVISNSLSKLKREGYDLNTFSKIPFTLTKKGIIIRAETDLGQTKLLLDTGFTLTMLHDYLYPEGSEKTFDHMAFLAYKSDKFILENKSFESQPLYFIKMAKELNDIDGFLGMDFISKHIVYIDFSSQHLYIK